LNNPSPGKSTLSDLPIISINEGVCLYNLHKIKVWKTAFVIFYKRFNIWFLRKLSRLYAKK
jgi:hypothetical protein